MRKRHHDDLDSVHFEQFIRTVIESIGEDKLYETIDYVLEQMADERRKLFNYAVETRRIEH